MASESLLVSMAFSKELMLSWFTRTFATLNPDRAKFPRAIAEDSTRPFELLDNNVTRYGPTDRASCRPFFSIRGHKLAVQCTAKSWADACPSLMIFPRQCKLKLLSWPTKNSLGSIFPLYNAFLNLKSHVSSLNLLSFKWLRMVSNE